MAHCMLPKYSDNDKSEIGSPGKYINLALPLMIEWFTSQRSQKHEIKTKLVGGAQILNDTLNIGIQNIEMIHKTLAKEGIKIEAEDLGGKVRTIHFIFQFRWNLTHFEKGSINIQFRSEENGI